LSHQDGDDEQWKAWIFDGSRVLEGAAITPNRQLGTELIFGITYLNSNLLWWCGHPTSLKYRHLSQQLIACCNTSSVMHLVSVFDVWTWNWNTLFPFFSSIPLEW
jgi:hypothetical protein